MNLPPDAARLLEEYLRDVEGRLSTQRTAVRRALIEDLRTHAHEAVRARAGAAPTAEDMAAVLAGMDAPEVFAETVQVPVAAAPSAPRRSVRWFALGLALLAVNSVAVFHLMRPDALSALRSWLAPARDVVVEEELPPLVLLSVEQVDLDAENREATLRVQFNAEPDRAAVARHLFLSEEGDPELSYRVMAQVPSNGVFIRTETVANDTFAWRLAEGLASLDARVGPTRAQAGRSRVSAAFRFREATVETPSFGDPRVRMMLNMVPDPASLAGRITVEPPVRFTAAPVEGWRGSGLELAGDFRPGARYTIALAAGLTSVGGTPLREAVTNRVFIPERPAGLQLGSQGRYLAPHGTLQVPVQTINVGAFTVALSRVYANNLVQFALRETGNVQVWGSAEDWLTGDRVVRTNRVAERRNESVRTLVPLAGFAADRPRGAYWLEVDGGQAGSERQLVVVTDLGLAVRRGTDGLWAWVNSLGAAQPVSGVVVAAYARNNQLVGRAVTDERGLAFVPTRPEQDAWLVTAEGGGDLTYLDLDSARVEQGEGLTGRPYLEEGGVEASLFTDRGVYRPGERMFVQALVRDRSLDAPAPCPVRFRLRKPDGRVVRDVPAMLDRLGAARIETVFDEVLPAGRYTIELTPPGSETVLGEAVVSMESFVPPQVRAALEMSEQRAAAGEVVSFAVSAAHLFGRPAAGLRARGAVTFKAEPFRPAGWAGWVFGDEEKSFASVYRPLGSEVLDEEGRAFFTAETAEAWRPPAAVRVVAEAVVTEASGRSVSAYGSAVLDAYPFYVGLRLADGGGGVRAGETQRVEVVELAPAGAPVAEAKALHVSLYSAQWTHALRKNSGGRYVWTSQRNLTLVREDTLAAGGAVAAWPFAVDQAGDYVLIARDPSSGVSSSLRFWAGEPGQGWTAWSRERPDRVELALDRTVYQPGDTARLLVKAPFAGRGLLTIASDRVLEQRVVELAANTAVLDVKVDAAFAPNVYCTFTLIRPAVAEEVWTAHRAVGAVALAVEPPGRRLAVEIASPGTNRPAGPLEAVVRVRDEAGAPAQGEVVVFAVDEAICMLTALATPDPLADFLARRALGVESFDLYSALMPVVDEVAEGVARIGGDEASGLRRRLNPIKARRFKPLALWRAGLALDTNGEARAVFDLPEFSGEVRLMAVAWNGRQAGSAARAVKVRRELVVQPSLPRFLAPGDRAEAVLELFNEAALPLEVRAQVTCGGPLRAEAAPETFTLAAGASRRVAVPLVAGPQPGTAVCVVEVAAGGETYRESIELAVRPAAGLASRSTFRRVASGTTEVVDAPVEWLPGTGATTLRIAGAPLLRYAAALAYARQYPYGCLEQTVSGLMPLLHLGELAGAEGSGAWQDELRSGLWRVLAMQRPEGGFALWPFETVVDEQASLYAVHFLAEARAAGIDVPQGVWESALGWVRARLARPLPAASGQDDVVWSRDAQARAYACHVLALAGRPDAGWNARLREEAAELPFAAKVHTAAALLLAGTPREAVALLDGLGLPGEGPREIEGFFNSRARDAALLLSAWLDADPGHAAVPQLIALLDGLQVNGRWASTQDNGMALLALGKHAARTPPAARAYTGRATLGDGPAASFADGLPFRAAATGAVPCTIRNDGPGVCYVSVQHAGVPLAPPEEGDHGLKIRRTFHALDGAEVDPGVFAQGDMVIVALAIDPEGRPLANLVVEELLPAGWEIENPALATAQQVPWIQEKTEWCRHREARDDRLLLFTGRVDGPVRYYYAARAVTPGRFTYPAASVSCMYAESIRSTHGARTVEVVP